MGKQTTHAFLLLLFLTPYAVASEPYQKVWGKRIAIGTVVTISTVLFLWKTNPTFKIGISKMLLAILPEPQRKPEVPNTISTSAHTMPVPVKKSQVKPKKPVKPINNQPEITPGLLQQLRAGLRKASGVSSKSDVRTTIPDSNNRYAKLWYQWQQEKTNS